MEGALTAGFTGTRKGMSDEQKYTLAHVLGYPRVCRFRHGDCIGADAEAAKLASEAQCYVLAHPATIIGQRAYSPFSDFTYESKTPLLRNRDIVDQSDFLIACPDDIHEKLRSGTWSTIRWARRTRKPHIIIYPDGTWWESDNMPILTP